jgi:hypothetical protein
VYSKDYQSDLKGKKTMQLKFLGEDESRMGFKKGDVVEVGDDVTSFPHDFAKVEAEPKAEEKTEAEAPAPVADSVPVVEAPVVVEAPDDSANKEGE